MINFNKDSLLPQSYKDLLAQMTTTLKGSNQYENNLFKEHVSVYVDQLNTEWRASADWLIQLQQQNAARDKANVAKKAKKTTIHKWVEAGNVHVGDIVGVTGVKTRTKLRIVDSIANGQVYCRQVGLNPNNGSLPIAGLTALKRELYILPMNSTHMFDKIRSVVRCVNGKWIPIPIV